jgi:hypothetical protein
MSSTSKNSRPKSEAMQAQTVEINVQCQSARLTKISDKEYMLNFVLWLTNTIQNL